MNGEQHLAWCKGRAIFYLRRGEVAGGMAAFAADLTKHHDTNEMLQRGTGRSDIMHVSMTNDPAACIRFVEGFR